MISMDEIPPEILCHIFLRNLPHNHEQVASCDPTRNTALGPSVLAPLVASHVSRTWRHASLSCGELWSYLQISVDSKIWKCESKRKHILEIFDTWLSRTNGHPINYVFHCRLLCDVDIGMDRDVVYVITTLVSQQHRWKDVSIAWSEVAMFPAEVPCLVLTNMPMLTSLTLSLWFLGKSHIHLRATVNIVKSTKLKRLRLSGPYELDTGNAPINSLTESSSLNSYPSALVGIRDCLRFLRVAPNLTKFLFHSFSETPSMTHWENTEPVMVPRLRILTAPPFIMETLTLPSLEALLSCGHRNVSVSETCRSFFLRSRPPLTQLELHNEDADAFIPSLRLLPALKRLKLLNSYISEPFFHELAVDVPEHDFATDSRVVCPSLVFLELRSLCVGTDYEACINALLSMVKSRGEVLGTFKTAELMGVNDTNPQPRKITDLVEDDLRCISRRGILIFYGDVYPPPIDFY